MTPIVATELDRARAKAFLDRFKVVGEFAEGLMLGIIVSARLEQDQETATRVSGYDLKSEDVQEYVMRMKEEEHFKPLPIGKMNS